MKNKAIYKGIGTTTFLTAFYNGTLLFLLLSVGILDYSSVNQALWFTPVVACVAASRVGVLSGLKCSDYVGF